MGSENVKDRGQHMCESCRSSLSISNIGVPPPTREAMSLYIYSSAGIVFIIMTYYICTIIHKNIIIVPRHKRLLSVTLNTIAIY